MPYIKLDLQLFAEEGADTAGAETGASGVAAGCVTENPAGDEVATEAAGEQAVPAWNDLIKGKYKKEYSDAVKAAVDKRFKNQANLQSQIDSIDPMIRALAERYGIEAAADGGIPIEALKAKVLDDNSMYEEEAFKRGMSVEDLKQLKSLERENARLKAVTREDESRRKWNEVVQQGEQVRNIYPDFNFEQEMSDPQFSRMVLTFQRSGFNNAVQLAYEATHRDEIMGTAMNYAIERTQQKISNSIQSGMRRPPENGTQSRATAQTGGIDPSSLTLAQIQDLKKRAERGERITF